MTAPLLDHPQRDVLVAFGLGKLDPAESHEVESHLSQCQQCCETLLDLQGDTFIDLVRRADAGPEEVLRPVGSALRGVPDATIASASGPGDVRCELPPELVDHPRYFVVELLGRGGMGDVYKAEHKLMHRPVALKRINEKLVGNPRAVDRFRREVQAAAQLSHPNIVTAFDAEQAGHTHFLVMEYVDGTDLCDVVGQRGPLAVHLACDYIRQAAVGLQHAHQKGMVHRDIKPQNLMLSADGQVKILDFGLATLASDALLADPHQPDAQTAPSRLTTLGAMMGTPDFVSPEQAGDAQSADIRSDIYSLGCTFFFLLAGRPPFDEGSAMDRIKAHAGLDPEPIETVRADVPAAVADVLRRMMAKDPAERFQTPAEVADALAPFVDRHRSGQARVARTSSPSVSTDWKSALLRPWLNDSSQTIHPSAIAAGIALLFFGLLALAGTVIYIATDNGTLVIESVDENVEIVVARPRSDTHEGMTVKIVDRITGSEVTRLRSGTYRLLLNSDFSAFQLSKDYFVLRRGDKVVVKVMHRRDSSHPSDRSGAELGQSNRPSVELLATLRGHTGEVRCLAYSPDGALLASGGADRTAMLWDVETRTRVATLRGHRGWVNGLAFSPDGKLLATAGLDEQIKLWDVDQQRELAGLQHDGRVVAVAFSPDGTLLASTSDRDGTIRLWDVASRSQRAVIREGAHLLAFAPDGKTLASAGNNGVKFWDGETAQSVPSPLDAMPARSLAFSRDGNWLAAAHGPDTPIVIYDRESKQERMRLSGHHFDEAGPVAIFTLAFSPDRQWLASGTGSQQTHFGELKLWDLDTGQELSSFAEHTSLVWSVAFSPDGKTLAAASADATVRLWDVAAHGEPAPPRTVAVANRVFTGPNARAILSLAPTPDGERILGGGHGGRLGLWNVATGEQVYALNGHTRAVHSVDVSHDGCRAVSGSEDGSIFVWDLDSGEQVRSLDGHGARVQVVRFSPDGKLILTVNADYRHNRENSAWLWNAETGELVRELTIENGWLFDAEFSPDGRRIAAAEQKGSRVLLFDTETGAVIHKFQTFPTTVDQIAYSPDGRYLAFGHRARSRRDGKWDDLESSVVRLIDTESLEVVRTFHGHASPITDLAFSRDGRLLVSCSGGVHDAEGKWVESLDQTARVWDVATGRELCRLNTAERTDAVALTADARAVLTGGSEMLRLWQLPDDVLRPAAAAPSANQITAVRHFIGHPYTVHDVAFSPDGTRAISHGAGDGTLRLWDLQTGAELRRFAARCGAAAFSHDGGHVIAGTWDAEGQDDNFLIVWQTDTGKEVHRLKASSGVFEDVAVSSDGRHLASSHAQWWGPAEQRDNTLRIWDIQEAKLIRAIKVHTSNVTDAAFSPDGRTLLSASRDGTVRLWNVETGEPVRQFAGTGTEAFAVAFTPDGRRVLASYGPSEEGIKHGIIDDVQHCIVVMWDVETGDELRRFVGHRGCIKAIDVSPDGRLLLSASGSQFVGEPNADGTAKQTHDNTLRVWDLDTGDALAQLEHRTSLESAQFSPDGRQLLTSQYQVFTLWQLPSGFGQPAESPLTAAESPRPTARQIAFASNRSGNFEILLVQEDGSGAVNLTNHPAEDTGPAWSPDGRQIAFCSDRTGNLDIFVMQADGSDVRRLTTYAGIDRTPCWSPDGTKIAFVRHLDDDNWDVFAMAADGSDPVNLTRSPTDEADPAWSPDGTHILFSGAPGSQLSIMNADGTGHRMLSPRLASFTYPAWSPDGRRIAYTHFTQERDLELFVINRDGTGEEQLTTLGGLNTFAAWSPDGQRIAFQHRNPNTPGTKATLYLIEADGDDPHAITEAECHIGYGGGRPAWRPR